MRVWVGCRVFVVHLNGGNQRTTRRTTWPPYIANQNPLIFQLPPNHPGFLENSKNPKFSTYHTQTKLTPEILKIWVKMVKNFDLARFGKDSQIWRMIYADIIQLNNIYHPWDLNKSIFFRMRIIFYHHFITFLSHFSGNFELCNV